MSTERTSSVITVWAWTDHGDVPTSVFDLATLPTILADVTRMRYVSTVEVEIDGEILASGDDPATIMAEVDEALAWAAPTLALTA